jgi:hypothetical protein
MRRRAADCIKNNFLILLVFLARPTGIEPVFPP